MRPEPNLANPSKGPSQLEQIKALGGRMDELLQRTRRSHRNIECRLQQMLDRCTNFDLKPASPVAARSLAHD
jgi:hypothetical protein